MTKLQKSSRGVFSVTLSPTMVRKKGWKSGQELYLIEYPNGDIVIQEV